jgi:hypothetical protein
MAKKKKVKNDAHDLSGDQIGVNGLEGAKKMSLRFGGCIHEDHKQPIYAMSFYEPMAPSPKGKGSTNVQYFASVGSNRATVYTV